MRMYSFQPSGSSHYVIDGTNYDTLPPEIAEAEPSRHHLHDHLSTFRIRIGREPCQWIAVLAKPPGTAIFMQ